MSHRAPYLKLRTVSLSTVAPTPAAARNSTIYPPPRAARVLSAPPTYTAGRALAASEMAKMSSLLALAAVLAAALLPAAHAAGAIDRARIAAALRPCCVHARQPVRTFVFFNKEAVESPRACRRRAAAAAAFAARGRRRLSIQTCMHAGIFPDSHDLDQAFVSPAATQLAGTTLDCESATSMRQESPHPRATLLPPAQPWAM